jgi:deoxyribonuclease-4
MKFGAHVSTAKPFSDAIIRAQGFGCDCIQIFANPPQRWNPAVISDSEIERFNRLNQVANIGPIIIHSIYLINLASENPFYYSQSIASLIDDMKKAKKIGALGVNTHLGSTKGRELSEVMTKIELAIKDILAATDGDETCFIIENSAGAGNIIGDTLEEIGQIVKAVNSSRIKVLIDTAHAFESGYDLKNKSGIDKFVADFDREIGLDRLVGFHLNDSKTAQSSHRDRHADLGHGEIGLATFENIVNHPRLKDLFGILETPEDEITWTEQIKILRMMEQK